MRNIQKFTKSDELNIFDLFMNIFKLARENKSAQRKKQGKTIMK